MDRRYLSLIVALFAACCSAPRVDAQNLQKLNFLVPIRNVDEVYSPFVVAKYLGYYSAEGLDVNILPVGGSNEAAIQVGAGNGDVGLASPPEAIVGLQRGALDIRYFYQVYYADIWKVAVPTDSPITNLRDLRGKRIGVPVMGSAAVTYGKAYLTKAGLNPDTDVTFVPIGFGGQALAAAQQKMVDALLFYDVALVQFDLAGLKLRVIPTDREFDLLPDAGLLARNDTIQKRPKMLVGLGRAIAKGYDFTQANPAAAVKITWSLYPDSKKRGPEADVLKAAIAANQSRMKIWNTPENGAKHGLIHREAWEKIMSFLVKQKIIAAPIPVERVYTNALIDEINQYDRAAVSVAARNLDPNSIK